MEKKTALRQMMKQAKQKKIDSPFAKYTNTDELRCALCDQQIISETFWNAHVNGKEHKQKVIELKSNIQQKSAEHVFAKPAPVTSPSTNIQRGVKRSHDVAAAGESTSVNSQSALPADFFDNSSSKPPVITSKPVVVPTNESSSNALPEGFFDDPAMDAKVRKVEYVDKMEVEWDSFVKEMKQETNVSEKLEATDELDRDVERDLKETTELILRWQKIEELHDAKELRFKVKKKNTSSEEKNDDKDAADDVDDDNLEKELEGMYNWRQKRS